jgi:hypothetical protein
MFNLITEDTDHVVFLKDIPFELKKYKTSLQKTLDKNQFVTVQLEHCVNFTKEELVYDAQIRINTTELIDGEHSLGNSEVIKLDKSNYSSEFLNQLADEINQEISQSVDFAIMGGETPTGSDISEQTRDLFALMLANIGIRYNYNCSSVVVANAIQSITIAVTE